MKISYLLPEFGFTGGSVVLYNFMDELVKRGYEIYAITPETKVRWNLNMQKNLLKPKKEKKSINIGKYISRIPVSKLRKIDPIDRMIEQLLKNWEPCDITIATYFLTAFAAYELMDKTIPLYHMQHYEELFFPDNPFMRLKARQTYGLPINLMANSTWLKTQIKNRFGKDSYLLNPGIDLKIFHSSVDLNQKYRDSSKIRILQYADERQFKGYEQGAQVMEIIKDHYGDKVEWVLFGRYKSETHNNNIHLGKIFRDQLALEYSKAHLFFFPSWYESSPIPLLEAMACGTAPVTNGYGAEDFCTPNNTIITKSRDIDDMVKKIGAFIENTEVGISMVNNGQETVRNYTWEKRTDVLEKIFQDVQIHGIHKNFKDINDLIQGKNISSLNENKNN